ncbi:ABC transporter substrate-binding protein [Metabacillus sediminilitoris]|uniref:Iron-siderophore ABC transporter substrate-binding protein n=1 Tax=Metabacillus sediminilitoris TaxID=2567941 RepID=A0A4S4BJV8_9BACI|nr:iron-siderophore ABC transporter substrate-binding protein [Metabacillus sediminilitoris]QGQ45863.1 ABC transporter substrate-binding protein [Metabacillus sediminilitoris]THF74971.1 iron-siderophore ABC transporter substrate-binding protein [Metabacillus sediminilitoris]
MFRNNKLFSIMLCVIALMLLIAGCGNKATTTTSNEKEAASSQEQEERVVKHAGGETTIKGTPKRIVTLYQGANDTAVALGVKPVGIVESWDQQPIYEYLRSDLEGATIVGQELQPNLEEISKLKPDLIIASKYRHEKIYPQLSKIAPTIMDDTIYEWKDTLNLMADALNKQDKKAELLAEWDTRVKDFKSQMGDKLPIKATITNFRSDHMRVYYNSYGGSILKELGFEILERPAGTEGEDWGEKITSKERIPDLNADTFFNFNASKDSELVEKNYEEWTNHPLWKELDAVKNDKVFQVDEVYWSAGAGYKSANLMLDSLYEIYELEK